MQFRIHAHQTSDRFPPLFELYLTRPVQLDLKSNYLCSFFFFLFLTFFSLFFSFLFCSKLVPLLHASQQGFSSTDVQQVTHSLVYMRLLQGLISQ